MTRNNPEHLQVRLPLIEDLKSLGWNADRFQWEPEWRVPKTPSDASRREKGQTFDGYPTDLVIFTDQKSVGDFEQVQIIFETKVPSEEAGIVQLQIYLNHEPSAKLGVWTNGSQVARVYRAADGTLIVRKDRGLPTPDESLLVAAPEKLKWVALTEPSIRQLREAFSRILDKAVARDSRSTRRDSQLNEICNLLLTKLESDKLAQADPKSDALFQTWDTEETTAKRVRDYFVRLRGSHQDLFVGNESPEIHLNDHTIALVVYELGSFRLFDVPVDIMSQAFQVFRTQNLKSDEGQYFTPYPVIRSVVKMMEIHPSDRVIDPACGTGGFLIEAYKSLRERFPSMQPSAATSWAQRNLFGIDKDSINVKLTKAMMLILGDGSTHVYKADSLRTNLWPSEFADVGKWVADGQFTCILTNPPFGENLSFSAQEARAAGYTISLKPKKSGEADTEFVKGEYQDRELGIVFLERCYQLLVIGGRLGIILPETYFFSTSYKWFQGWIRERFIMRAMLNIPMEAFQGFCRAKTNFYIFEKIK